MVAEVERQLLLKCRAGDWKSYEPIVRAYEGRVYGLALGLLRDPEDARDLAQDALVRAFQSLDLYDPDRPFLGWLLGICRNLCIDHLRRRRSNVRIDRASIVAETRSLVWQAMERLSDEHREVLVLKDLQELEYADIARILNIPQGTVASRVYYARRALRVALEEMGVTYP
jgi:RNA polymerase sigma-70 factor (ECF subfamily)